MLRFLEGFREGWTIAWRLWALAAALTFVIWVLTL